MRLDTAPPIATPGLSSHLLAIGVLLLLIVALFWRVFFFGETLVDLATHQNQLPWGATANQYQGYPYSRRDLTDTYITRDYFVVDSYRNGELPLWNPYNFSGHPIYADGVTKLFAPTNLLYRWFDLPLGYSLARLLELALAAIFIYLLAVYLELGVWGGFIAAAVFIFSDHTLHHLTWLGWLGGLMWLPLMLLAADLAVRRDSILAAIASGLALAMQFYCGYMPTVIYYLTALAGYYLVSPWFISLPESNKIFCPTRKRRLLKAVGFMIVTLSVGFGLSALIWLPVFELLGNSNRKIVPTEIGYIWIPPWQLLTLILPRAFGQAFDPSITRRFLEVGVSQDRSVYIGLITLAFGFAAFWKPGVSPIGWLKNRLFNRQNSDQVISIDSSIIDHFGIDISIWRQRQLYYFAGLALFALLVMMSAPIYVHVTKYLPVLKTIRAVTRISGLFAFGSAIVAGYGAHRLFQLSREQLSPLLNSLCRVTILIVGLAISGIIIFSLIGRYLPQDHEQGNRIRRWLLKIVITLTEQLHWSQWETWLPIGIMLALMAICWAFLRADYARNLLMVFLAALLLGELIWNGNQYNRSFPRANLFPKTAATELLKEKIGLSRLLVVPPEFSGKNEDERDRHKIVAPPNTLLPYKLATIAGKDQLFPRWYREMTSLVEPQKFLSHIVFNKTDAQLYDFLGVKYLITRDVNTLSDPDYREIYQGEGVRIYENLAAMPRAFFAERTKTVYRPQEAIALMFTPEFDPREVVVVMSKRAIPKIDGPIEGDKVEITSYQNNQVSILAKSAGTRMLVLTDTYYPGWEVTIDNQPAELVRVDHALRGVVITAGEHQVEFKFRPRSFQTGIIISIVTLIASLLVTIGVKLRNLMLSRSVVRSVPGA